MKNFKDFLYDKNDILIAVAILAIAIGLIMWRLNAIMDYPSTLVANAETQTEEPADTGTDSSTADKSDNADKPDDTAKPETTKPEDGESTSFYTDSKLNKDITVTVSGGSATAAVQCLIDKGLFTSYDDYSSACKSANRTPEDIKANTFTFASGSTKSDIVKMVTK